MLSVAPISNRRLLLVAALTYGLAIWLLLPAGVVAIDDDFGYLRSVVATIQRGRPWTDDWLEPWAASLSALAAVLFRVTGSFVVAVHGSLVALATAAFVGAFLLLRQRGMDRRAALGVAALLLTFPTVLWKSAEFTSMALYVPCLLIALWSSERSRWWLFFVVWTLAVASRQSALTWLLIPAWNFVGHARTVSDPRTKWSWAAPLLVVFAGVGVFWALHVGMNQTHAQAMLTTQAFGHISASSSIQVLAVGALIYLAAAGCGTFVVRGSDPSTGFDRASKARVVTAVMLLAALLVCDARDWLQFEHTLSAGAIGWIYTKMILALAVVGWFRGGVRLRAEHAFYAAGSLALVAVRGARWDYYFIDVAVFGFFGVGATRAVASLESPRTLARWPMIVLATFHVLFFLDLKCTLDRARALCVISETALRDGRLQAAELSFAPFGFRAWHLYPYYVKRDGIHSADLAGFRSYLRPGAVEVGQGYSRILHALPRFRHEPPADRTHLVASGSQRFAWFFVGKFFLLRFKTEAEQPAEVPLSATEYTPPLFPLNDREWRELIERGAP